MRGLKMSAMAIAAMAAGASAQNLMSNGSFEDLGPGFILFQDWDNFNNVFVDESVELVAQDGTNSAKMFGQFGGEQSDQVLLQTVTGIVEGNEYSLSAYAQHLSTDAVQAGNLVLLQLNFQDSSGTTIGSAIQSEAIVPDSTPTDQWLQTTVSGVAPAGTTQILVALLHLQLDGAAPGATFWDNVELVQGAGPVEPCEGDFNGDGQLNFFDFVDFINAFNAGCPE